MSSRIQSVLKLLSPKQSENSREKTYFPGNRVSASVFSGNRDPHEGPDNISLRNETSGMFDQMGSAPV